MNITMEQVEKVRACTDCSYEEAKTVLEQTGGNVLDAVILLEQKGAQKSAGGDYSTRAPKQERPSGQTWRRPTGREVRRVLGEVVENCLSVTFEVWKSGAMTCRVPLLAAILLVIVAPYAVVALFLVGLCLGYRIHLSGRGTEGWGAKVNAVSDEVADTVHDAVKSLRKDKKTNRK